MWTPRKVTGLILLLAFIGCQIGSTWAKPLYDLSWLFLIMWVFV